MKITIKQLNEMIEQAVKEHMAGTVSIKPKSVIELLNALDQGAAKYPKLRRYHLLDRSNEDYDNPEWSGVPITFVTQLTGLTAKDLENMSLNNFTKYFLSIVDDQVSIGLNP